MSRQSQTNTFNDGLNKDLTPLLTPNTVMTDCLNGTIVTYNGNEFALQNDMGNYKFNHGSLNEGFVPVGIKEHANILYIVSYNPITNEVEIGSFPSSKTIFKSEINNYSNSAGIELPDETWINYTELIKGSQLTLLSPLEEDYKLNPGDMYILEKGANTDYDNTIEQINKNNLWQHTSTYVFTENNKLYNIDGFIEFAPDRSSSSYTLDDFSNVKWDVPGWIAVKPIVNVMDEFNCYVHNIEHKIDGDSFIAKAKINIQSIWSTKVYKGIIEDLKTHLGYLVYTYNEGSEDYNVESVDFAKLSEYTNHIKTYNDIYSVIHTEIEIESKCDYVKIVPVLWIDHEENDTPDGNDRYIIYDQFETVVTLEQKEWNVDDIVFGSDIFNYYVGDKELILSFDLNAPAGAKISYQLQRYLDPRYGFKEVEDKMYDVFATPQEIIDVVDSGQNIISIPFSTADDGKQYYEAEEGKPNYFDKEDYYKLIFYIYPEDTALNNVKENEQYCKKVDYELYVSEYINYYHGLYDNYKCDEFNLNKEAFIEAIERGMRLNIEFENESNSVIKFDGNTINDVEELFKDKLDKYYYKDGSIIKRYSKNPGDFDINPEIKYGTSRIVKTPTICKLKDQYGNEGRFWRNTNYTNLIINGIDENDNYVQFSKENDTYSLDVLSEFIINSNNYSITKTYPEDPLNYKSMYTAGSFIEESEDGWYKFNENAFMWKDKGREGYSCGTWSPKDNAIMKFKIIGNEITIKLNDKEKTYEYGANGWAIPENDTFLSQKFKHSYNWVNNDGSNSGASVDCRKNVSLKLKYPGYVVFFNHRERGWDYYYGINSPKDNMHFGTENQLRLFSDDDPNFAYNANNRYFYGIAVSGRPDDADFFLILPETVEFNNGYIYMMKSFLTYLCMMVFVKYCIKSETNTYYIPAYSVSDNKTQNITINKIECYSQIKYCYPKLNGNECEDQIEIFFDQELNKTFQNNMDGGEIFEKVKEFFTTLNDKISESIDFNFNEIKSGEMFVDKDYIGPLRPILNNIALMLDYKGGYFKLKEIVQDYNLTMRSSDNNYDHVCHINNVCYDEI